MYDKDIIVAPATTSGGALSVVRLSGQGALEVFARVFRSATGRDVRRAKGFSALYGHVVEETGEVVDEVVATVFRAPKSYTGDDMVEVSCHGSPYIVSRIVSLLTGAGARLAEAGEFTVRAFLAGKMDLSQAEAVADMIASHDRATHRLAWTQMRGGYSDRLGSLRVELVGLASLLELELDFSEEDVEFADRGALEGVVSGLCEEIKTLIDSFRVGNAMKHGIGVAIVGKPNAGKSTLLNALLGDDRAIVSDIAGTTRDVLEERLDLEGVSYRFIDTAGLRESGDTLELMGMERTLRAVERAAVVLLLVDATLLSSDPSEASAQVLEAVEGLSLCDDRRMCVVLNKADAADIAPETIGSLMGLPVIAISAKYGHNIDALKGWLVSLVERETILRGDPIVSTERHAEALRNALEALTATSAGMSAGLPADLLAQDIRRALHWLGTITGEVTTDEILGEIFSKFCIGK